MTTAAAQQQLVDWIIVAARQRSSSTALSCAIAADMGSCASIYLDELYQGGTAQHALYSAMGSSSSSSPWESPTVRQRKMHPLQFLRHAREVACNSSNLRARLTKQSKEVCSTAAERFATNCNMSHSTQNGCTLVFKLFDIHGVRFLNSLFAHSPSCVVVLRRTIADEECSYRWALLTGDWTTNRHSGTLRNQQGSALENFRTSNCTNLPTASFARSHEQWFGRLYRYLRGTRHLNATFEESIYQRARLLQRVRAVCHAP